MGYEVAMQADIAKLLALFRGRVPDQVTHNWVSVLAADRGEWARGHEVFWRVRDRLLSAGAEGDHLAECQYAFEEVCLQTLYNETNPTDPFDGCTPYWVLKNALALARRTGLSADDVADAIGLAK